MTRIINPTPSNPDFRTEISIRPSCEDYLSVLYPDALVTVDFLYKGQSLFHAFSEKVLSDTPMSEDCYDIVAQTAWLMIHGDLSAVGLDGLNTLDLYGCMGSPGLPLQLSDDRKSEIILNKLGLRCVEVSKTSCDHLTHKDAVVNYP